MADFNTLVIHVIQARSLNLKGSKSTELYASLSTAGRSKWKSKVTTNPVVTSTRNCEWNEHCEFQLTDIDAEIHIHVNHKTVFGTTETLGEVILNIEQMARYLPPKWFRLTKKHDANKERGELQLEYQFSNKFASSISNFSLNKIEKEKKFEKLKRKMHLIGRNKKATADVQSMASVSLSRKSSFSSNASALAFNSPSPNHMMMLSGPENHLVSSSSSAMLATSARGFGKHRKENLADDTFSVSETVNEFGNHFTANRSSNSSKDDSGMLEFDAHSIHSDVNTATAAGTQDGSKSKTKMWHKAAEQLLNIRHKKQIDDESALESSSSSHHQHSSVFSSLFHNSPMEKQHSRPNSIASSSGFASLGSGNLGALNESTSPEYLLNVIKHLRRELTMREDRIRDLEQYTDKLISKVIETHPELLQASPKPAYR